MPKHSQAAIATYWQIGRRIVEEEQSGARRAGQWARSITKKHRLVYLIKELEVIVAVLSAYGHYDDK